MDTIDAAARLKPQHGRYAYVAPFLAQAKEVAWEYLKRFAQPILADKNESELWVELVNGARIRIHGADNPDRLRGSYLDGVVLDEYADMRPGVWGEVIRPMLADRSGWAVFIGTPKGRNEFFEICDRAERSPDWFALTLRASETGILSASELDDAKLDMTPEQFAQEFECSFEAAILGAYYGKEMAEVERSGRILDLPADLNAPVHVAWDLGVGDSTALWFFQMVGPEVHVIDHYEATGYAINHYAGVIKNKPYPRGTDYVPHDALQRSFTAAGPDGKARQRIEVMLECGLSPKVVPQHRLEDGISAVRQTLPRCRFDAVKCRDGLEALRQYRSDYDEKAKAFRDKPLHNWASHSADAFRYLAVAWQEVAKPKPQERPQHAFVAQPDGSIRSTLSVHELIKRNAKLRKQRGR
jgi:phage terminase large subunit